MNMSDIRPHNTQWHPYRVTKQHDRRAVPMTAPQRAVLEALVHLCPTAGAETCPRRVAACAGLRYGSTMLTLRNLQRQRLATEHCGAGEPAPWSPTLIGRSRVRSRGRHGVAARSVQSSSGPTS